MPFDWLFGSKKRSDTESQPSAKDFEVPDDNDVICGNEANSASGGIMRSNSSLPYNLAPLVENPSDDSAEKQAVNQNVLHGIPFKLSASDTSQDIDSATAYQFRAAQFFSYISENLASDAFNYDFKVERGVVREAGSRDLG